MDEDDLEKYFKDEVDYSLTPEQKKAFNALERTLKKCKEKNIFIWSNYGTISGVNGNIVRNIETDSWKGQLDELDMMQVEQIINIQVAETSDDRIFVLLHNDHIPVDKRGYFR